MHQPLEFLIRHGYAVLFTWTLIELLGVPFPALPVLLAMGALIGTGQYSFGSSVGLVMLAAGLADSAWYALGRRNGHTVLKLVCRISLEPDSCVSMSRFYFKKLGSWALVFSKFVPGLTTIAAPMAGLSRMPVWKFLSADSAGSLLWGSTLMGLGFVFREQLEDVGRLAARLGGMLVAILVAALALWILYKWWQRRRFIRSLRMARITPEEVMERLSEVALVDLRSATEVEFDGRRLPGAMWFERKELEQNAHLIPRDRDVVLYCT